MASDPTNPPREEINPYIDWITSIGCWDGILPIFVALVGPILTFIIPGRQDVAAFFNLVIPLGAFGLRATVGYQRLVAPGHRWWQLSLFSLAILFLLVLDAWLILLRTVPPPPQGFTVEYWGPWWTCYIVYLLMMAVALFPFGKARPSFDK